jgi:hypothetical protein
VTRSSLGADAGRWRIERDEASDLARVLSFDFLDGGDSDVGRGHSELLEASLQFNLCLGGGLTPDKDVRIRCATTNFFEPTR